VEERLFLTLGVSFFRLPPAQAGIKGTSPMRQSFFEDQFVAPAIFKMGRSWESL